MKQTENAGSVGRRNEIACTTVGDITVAVIGFSPCGHTNRVTDRTTAGLLNLSSLVRCYTARLVREHVAQLSRG
jgi:hypothetical protein